MKKEWNDVREFHDKFGHPVAHEPGWWISSGP